MNLFLAFFLAGAVSASAQAPAASLMRIGAAAAVKGVVNAIAPGTTVGRVVESGKPLFLNDHVTTDAAGRLQVLLLDETVFTVGPNSDMVLDEFVYDPASAKGKVTARITKGVFRFVTGKVARKDPASMKVTLPVGTIGIRGTIAAGQVSDQSATVILLGPGSQNNANENPGAVSVFNTSGLVNLTQPGFGTTLTLGQPPTPPTNMPLQLQNILGALGVPPSGSQSSSGGTGTSATQASGQGTAAGGALVRTSGDILNLADSTNNTQQGDSQTQLRATLSQMDTIADGLSTWDQVRSIQTGVGYVNGVGDYTCSGTGGFCSAGGSGQFGFNISVDFGARQLATNNSYIELISGQLPTTSASIIPVDFSALTGNAAYSLKSSDLSGDTGFTGTVLSFQNRDGTAAKDMKVDLNYTNMSNDKAVGSQTVPISATAPLY